MPKSVCTDRVVNSILASWRYDISGIPPEMRRDYENHLAECHYCRSHQKFHRRLDIALVVLTSLLVFLSAAILVLLWHFRLPGRVALTIPGFGDAALPQFLLLLAAFAGFLVSVAALVLVLTATPAPAYLGGLAAERAKMLEERLPSVLDTFRSRS